MKGISSDDIGCLSLGDHVPTSRSISLGTAVVLIQCGAGNEHHQAILDIRLYQLVDPYRYVFRLPYDKRGRHASPT